MVFIKIYIKDGHYRNDILDWLMKRITLYGQVSLLELFSTYHDKLIIENNDLLSYHDVGWNELDGIKLWKFKVSSTDLNIPTPKCPFKKHYT